ncbi:hypothetical protein TNIN_305111 [Trichonephila inaurata madagascariensis]|uniref:Uncharacterized protein n=1 Tax=Trichonephila inaurata madagascariensis TaxID=2747483 RepID=A0A8X7CL17_9ARAC|nr:hypothetical protein TNIN_305111 [Trichonephila inaurata madagascariensis]
MRRCAAVVPPPASPRSGRKSAVKAADDHRLTVGFPSVPAGSLLSAASTSPAYFYLSHFYELHRSSLPSAEMIRI